MAQRGTSLGPKPLFVFLFVFLLCFGFFFGGLKGQVRWPKGPPHLALSPPHVSLFLSIFCFSFVFNRKTFLFISQCLPLYLLSLFFLFFTSLSLSPFYFLFLCLSLSLFLSLFSSFLLVFHFLRYFASLVLSFC